jgi:hypothetical protein
MSCVGRKLHAGLVVVALVTGGSRASSAMNDPDASLASDAGTVGLDAAPEAGTPDGAQGASDAGAAVDACARTACPVAEPAVGDSCDPSTAACEYGDDPRYECDRIYACMSGHFQIETVRLQSPADLPDASGCPTALAAGCPPSLASVTVGAACTPNLQCPYVDGECACFVDDDSGAGVWACAPGNILSDSDAACPVVRPHLGASCPAQSGYCAYDFDCAFEVCSCGEWVAGYSECPLRPNAPPPVDAGVEGGPNGSDGSDLDGSAGRSDSGFVGANPASGAGGTSGGGGCGCRIAGRTPGAASGVGVFLGVALLIRRRRHRGPDQS